MGADELVALANDLAKCAEELSTASGSAEAASWAKVELIAQQIANGLRSRTSDDQHGQVGATKLPETLQVLLNKSRTTASSSSSTFTSPSIPNATTISAAYELLRIGANVCMDHDVNRGRLLAARVPQTVLNLLEGYSDLLLDSKTSNASDPASSLSIADLKVVKTAFGVLLNSSMEYKPIRTVLLDQKAPGIILRLTSVIYPAGLWLKAFSTGEESELAEHWSWRAGLSAWSWRALESIRPEESDVPWDEEALPHLIRSLDAFVPPHAPVPAFAASDPELQSTLLSADVNVLQEVASLVEALSADDDRVRALLLISSGGGKAAPADLLASSSPDTPFAHMIRFVEAASPLQIWGTQTESVDKEWKKTLAQCKAAVIKAIVTVSGEDSQMDVLWGQNDPNGGWFVEKMVQWVKEYQASKEARDDEERDDLVICGALCLGNLARREDRSIALVERPIAIVPYLIPLLARSYDIKLKNGVIGILKNLAVSPKLRDPLGQLGVVEAVAKSGVWDRTSDMAETVQVYAIGVVKHLINGNVVNSVRLFQPAEEGSTGLDLILDLIRRTDSQALRNESTRVLVNLVKALWVSPVSTNTPVKTKNEDLPPAIIEQRRKAFDELMSEETADALAEMIGRNSRYPILLNEGILALTLLSRQSEGVGPVATALLSPLGPEPDARSPQISEASTSTAPNDTTSNALEQIIQLISSPKARTFPPELRANACSLLANICRKDPDIVLDEEKAALRETIRHNSKPALVALASEPPPSRANSLEQAPPASPVTASMKPTRNPNLLRDTALRTLGIYRAWETSTNA